MKRADKQQGRRGEGGLPVDNPPRLAERIGNEFERCKDELRTKMTWDSDGVPMQLPSAISTSTEAYNTLALSLRCELLEGTLFAAERLEELGHEVIFEEPEEPGGVGRYRLRTPDPKVEAMPEWELLMAVESAQLEMKGRDPLMCVLAGMELTRQLLAIGRHDLARLATVGINSFRGQKPRTKPRLGTRALLIAMAEGNSTAASVAECFDAWRGKPKDDEWGGLSLDAADDFDGWEIIDEGASVRKDGEKPSGEIRRASLASMISRAKKKPS